MVGTRMERARRGGLLAARAYGSEGVQPCGKRGDSSKPKETDHA